MIYNDFSFLVKTKTISVCKSGGLDGKNQLGHIGQEEPEMLGKQIR